MSNLIPTRSLQITDASNWKEEMLAFASQLEHLGERAWFEVRWPVPEHLSQEDSLNWILRQEDTFDAVEVINGEIHTLPPYVELIGGVK